MFGTHDGKPAWCVDVRSLPEITLVRLHLIASKLQEDQRLDELTNWAQIASATEAEIGRRGLTMQQVQRMADADAACLAWLLAAFREQQERERAARLN